MSTINRSIKRKQPSGTSAKQPAGPSSKQRAGEPYKSTFLYYGRPPYSFVERRNRNGKRFEHGVGRDCTFEFQDKGEYRIFVSNCMGEQLEPMTEQLSPFGSSTPAVKMIRPAQSMDSVLPTPTPTPKRQRLSRAVDESPRDYSMLRNTVVQAAAASGMPVQVVSQPQRPILPRQQGSMPPQAVNAYSRPAMVPPQPMQQHQHQQQYQQLHQQPLSMAQAPLGWGVTQGTSLDTQTPPQSWRQASRTPSMALSNASTMQGYGKPSSLEPAMYAISNLGAAPEGLYRMPLVPQNPSPAAQAPLIGQANASLPPNDNGFSGFGVAQWDFSDADTASGAAYPMPQALQDPSPALDAGQMAFDQADPQAADFNFSSMDSAQNDSAGFEFSPGVLDSYFSEQEDPSPAADAPPMNGAQLERQPPNGEFSSFEVPGYVDVGLDPTPETMNPMFATSQELLPAPESAPVMDDNADLAPFGYDLARADPMQSDVAGLASAPRTQDPMASGAQVWVTTSPRPAVKNSLACSQTLTLGELPEEEFLQTSVSANLADDAAVPFPDSDFNFTEPMVFEHWPVNLDPVFLQLSEQS
ncbi:hypothetical protein MBLNU230_g2956t1 [Neophaeotheca triangularis]